MVTDSWLAADSVVAGVVGTAELQPLNTMENKRATDGKVNAKTDLDKDIRFKP